MGVAFVLVRYPLGIIIIIIDGGSGCLPQSYWLLTPSCEGSAPSWMKMSKSCCCHFCGEFVLGVKITFPKRGNVILHLMSEVGIKSSHSSDLL